MADSAGNASAVVVALTRPQADALLRAAVYASGDEGFDVREDVLARAIQALKDATQSDRSGDV